MTTTIKATGDFVAGAPTVTVSHGRGNTDDVDEVHLMLRDATDEQTFVVRAWFPRAELLAAINSGAAA